MIYIYKYTNIINGKLYIGSTQEINTRKQQHISNAKYERFSHYYFYRAVNKYGWESFMFDVIEECCPLLRNDRENHWIKYYQTINPMLGYNMKLADSRWISEEIRQKISDKNKGKKLTPEVRLKISAAGRLRKHTPESKQKIAESNRRRGKWSIESRDKLSKSKLGTKVSNETKQKISKAQKNRPKSEEHRQKISQSNIGKHDHSGENNPMYGKHLSDASKQKIRESRLGTKRSEDVRKILSEAQKKRWKKRKQQEASEEWTKHKSLF